MRRVDMAAGEEVSVAGGTQPLKFLVPILAAILQVTLCLHGEALFAAMTLLPLSTTVK